MLVQLLHPQEWFLIICQHAQEWIFEGLSEVAKALCGAFGICINLKEVQSAVVLVVHRALEVVSAVHCQKRNEINNHRKENRD